MGKSREDVVITEISDSQLYPAAHLVGMGVRFHQFLVR